jgi:hypothetical protein
VRGDWITRLSYSEISSDVFCRSWTAKGTWFDADKRFLFGGLSPPNKKCLLGALCVFAVKILTWAVNHFTLEGGLHGRKT